MIRLHICFHVTTIFCIKSEKMDTPQFKGTVMQKQNPANFTRTLFLQASRVTLDYTELKEVSSKRLQKSLDQQERVGLYLMSVGFLLNEWTVALGALSVDCPQSTTVILLAMTWEHICDLIWMARNNILHSAQNHVSTD